MNDKNDEIGKDDLSKHSKSSAEESVHEINVDNLVQLDLLKHWSEP